MESLSQIRFSDGETLYRLPDWAQFCVATGKLVAGLGKDSQATLGIIAPTRRFAAAFCAAGTVFQLGSHSPEEGEIEAHLESLRAHHSKDRTSPTSVTYLKGKRILRGQLKEIGREVKIQVNSEKGDKKAFIVTSDSKKILRIGIREPSERELPMSQKGRSIRSALPFLRSVLPDRDPCVFLARSRLECVLVGQIKRLKSEIREVSFAVETNEENEEACEGRLQDLLRVERFGYTREGYRARICKSAGNSPPVLSEEDPPPVVFFDGAAGFMKWRDRFPDSHHVVVIERQDRSFEDAVNQLKRDSFMRRGPVDLSPLPAPPAGTEIMGYWR